MTALAPLTLAVSATVQVRSTSAAVLTSQKGTATAMATSLTPWAFVAVTVQRTPIPAGDCDCDGNQLDALGVCGGDCAADADADGICDDVDDCIGAIDACGICNGPGAIYECGCSDIPAGDCDCDGNQLDALGVCGGDCAADANGNGVCDDAEISGCTDDAACNYDADATEEDGSCDFCSCARAADYTLTVQAAPAVTAGLTTYRFYVDMQDRHGPHERGVWQRPVKLAREHAMLARSTVHYNSSWNASGINPAFLPVFPDLADDTYATSRIGGPCVNFRHCWCRRSFRLWRMPSQPITPYFLTQLVLRASRAQPSRALHGTF